MTRDKGRGVSRRSLLQAGGLALAALGTTEAAKVAAASNHGTPPRETERFVTVVEGTNIAASVAPDGKTIAFDLYGVLWLVGIEGGVARRLTDDITDMAQPDWSPDGRTLVFQSYRDGNFHLWSIGADGDRLTQLTRGPYDCREPRFSPDGRRIAFSSDRSGLYAVHILDLASGEISALPDSTSQEAEPVWSPDGSQLAVVGDKTKLVVVDMKGKRRAVHSITPSADMMRVAEVRGPSWSPDGRSMLYTVLANGTSTLMQDGRALIESEDVFPFRVTWLSAREFIYTSSGKIRRRSLDSPAASIIDFAVTVPVVTHSYRRKRRDFSSSTTEKVLGIGSPVLSPDGQQVAFRALNDLWTMKIGAKPVPLLRDRFYKCDPAWSPDGSRLAYSSDRGGKLDLWLRDLHTGEDAQLTHFSKAAVSAAWSPDGKLIAFLDQTGSLHTAEVATGVVRKVFDALWEPGRPTWSADGKYIAMAAFKPYSARYREGLSEILVIELATRRATYTPAAPNLSLSTRGDDGPIWSPDGKSMAFVVGSVLWVVPVAADGQFTGPARTITDEVTDAPSWSGDSKSLLYLCNGKLRLVSATGGKPRTVPLELSWTRAQSTRRTILRVGRLWDGFAPEYRRNVDVIIEGNRIADVVPSTSRPPSDANATFIDAPGQTLMPGLVDMHTHRQMQGYCYGDRQGRLWLAMGVTTTRSPGAPAYHMVEDREAIDAGLRIGPRHYATGEAIDGSRIFYNFMRPVTDERQLALELERAEALSYDMIKTYVRMSPERQRKVIDWAHARGMPISSHYHFPSLRFGGDCMEHLGATNRLGYSRTMSALGAGYQDVTALFVQSQAGRTPTLFTSGALLADDRSLVDDPRVKTLYPSWEYARLVERATQMAASDRAPILTQLQLNVAQVRDMLRGGGRVLCGTDAPIDFVAVSLHLNLRAMVKYGLTPYEAMLTATRFPGEFLEESLGIVAPGALADLLLIDGDPLARIEDAAAVRQVIKNGEVFTIDDLIGPFAGNPGATTQIERTFVSADDKSSAPEYWWHASDYVEESRTACCASHLSPVARTGELGKHKTHLI